MRYSVLTYIFDKYDKVHEVKEKDPDADYILITDNPSLKSRTWKVVYDEELAKLPTFTKCYKVRFNPFKYVDTDIVIRLDASIGINKSLKPFINEFVNGGYDRGLMIHPQRNSIKKEYDIWRTARKYPKSEVDKCINFMTNFGYDFEYKGLFQGCFDILRNNFINTAINRTTYNFLYYLRTDKDIQRINQTVLSFVINKLYCDIIKVMPIDENAIIDGKYMTWYLHNSDRKILPRKDKISPMMFNKPIVTFGSKEKPI